VEAIEAGQEGIIAAAISHAPPKAGEQQDEQRL
jgi:hypothetical protein